MAALEQEDVEDIEGEGWGEGILDDIEATLRILKP